LNVCDIVPGRERLAPGSDRPRHRHLLPYAIVVLRGSFDQTSYAGRVRVVAGDLLVQPTLDCHANRLASADAEILRLPWHDVDSGRCVALADVDAIARAAERDVHEAVALAREGGDARRAANDLRDELATALAGGEVGSLGAWARARGVARETMSRGFSLAYGVSARRFRVELQARAAWLAIVRSRRTLAAIAQEAGFADQAHMTRAVRAVTGSTPARWRRDPRVVEIRVSPSAAVLRGVAASYVPA
jgi:AraC-like DNA-binding protein